MNDIIIKQPKIPEVRFRKCKRCLNNVKLPRLKLPRLKTNQTLVLHGMLTGLIAEVTKVNSIKNQRIGDKEMEKPVTGAGRGGKHYSQNKSHYERF